MPRISYIPYKPTATSAALIADCIDILDDFEGKGFLLTLRQLYYQLVAADRIPNNQKSYTRLGEMIARAREGGLIDWDRIVDRTRAVESFGHWRDGDDFLQKVADQFMLDLWHGQRARVFVFVEKQALEEVVAQAADHYDCSYLSNKGYLSASAVWSVAHNLMMKPFTFSNLDPSDTGGVAIEKFVVLHLGDHDPSGLDMTRDIRKRLELFSTGYTDDGLDWMKPEIVVDRIALNREQIEKFNPPPNPAKQTDSRYRAYVEDTGFEESWELDAIEPDALVELIKEKIYEHIDDDEQFTDRQRVQAHTTRELKKLRLP